MKEVICIQEDNHGLVGVAKDYKSAIDFLMREEWLDGNIELIDENDNDTTIKERFGLQWDKVIRKWDNIDKFNNEFEGIFYLEVMKVEGS